MIFVICFSWQILTPKSLQLQSSGFRGLMLRHKKNDGSTLTTTVSARKSKEKKHQYRKRKMDMDQYILTRKAASKRALATKAPRVNTDALKPGGDLARRLNHDNLYCPKPVTGSGVFVVYCPPVCAV